MLRLPKRPAIWFSALLCWLGLLWFLSSMPGTGGIPDIQHIDKAAHFTYFLAGGLLLAGCQLSIRPQSPDWRQIIITTAIVMAMIGWLDEWHQTFIAGRSGGDFWDWLADFCGGLAGAFLMKTLHQRRE